MRPWCRSGSAVAADCSACLLGIVPSTAQAPPTLQRRSAPPVQRSHSTLAPAAALHGSHSHHLYPPFIKRFGILWSAASSGRHWGTFKSSPLSAAGTGAARVAATRNSTLPASFGHAKAASAAHRASGLDAESAARSGRGGGGELSNWECSRIPQVSARVLGEFASSPHRPTSSASLREPRSRQERQAS